MWTRAQNARAHISTRRSIQRLTNGLSISEVVSRPDRRTVNADLGSALITIGEDDDRQPLTRPPYVTGTEAVDRAVIR